MKLLATGVILSVLKLVSSHMELFNPAPRDSKYLSGVQSGQIDYSMTSPLGSGRPFPCIGYGPGPIGASYTAGSTVSIELKGTANHNGGHCQISLSYDGKIFVGIKNIFGDCMMNSLKYDVTIPKDAPGGRAVFAWSWINRSGNREYYMNCADVNIVGNPKSTLTGHEIVIGNFDVPGKTNYEFPEGFSNDFGKQFYQQTPVYTISPSSTRPSSSNGGSVYTPPSQNTAPSSQKPAGSGASGYPETNPINAARPQSQVNTPPSTSPIPINQPSPHQPPPSYASSSPPSTPNPTTCQHGEMKCHTANSFSICNNNVLSIFPCAATLRCTDNGKVNCVP